jgi:hypothetical protein
MLWLLKFKKQLFYLFAILIIQLFQTNSSIVEHIYFDLFYKQWSSLLRKITSIFIISLGDIFYLLLILFIVFRCLRFFKNFKSYFVDKSVFSGRVFLPVFNFCFLVFILFKLFWGLNYYRGGVALQFNISKENYCKEQLNKFIDELVEQTNHTRSLMKDTTLPSIEMSKSFKLATESYHQISKKYHFLTYSNPSVKSSIFSKVGNYSGFVGYFNPFSGEAQVRNDIPQILTPFIATHEIAHQLGYASESEASFIGYMVCENSTNIYMRYSIQLELLDLALSDLLPKYLQDGAEMEEIRSRYFQIYDCLSNQVKKDRNTIKAFFNKNRKSVANLSNTIYDKYLKINNQYAGVESYNEVLAWVLSEKKVY